MLDGRNRLTAMELVGIDLFDDQGDGKFYPDIQLSDGYTSDFQRVMFGVDPKGVPETDPWEYVVSANVHRRHLSGDQKRDLVATLLKASPERSDRATAAIAKVSPTTVGTVRRDLEKAGDVSNLDTRIDTVGRAQPARRLGEFARIISAEELDKHRENAVPAPIEDIAAEKDAVRRLDELLRALRVDAAVIAALPRSMRILRARVVLEILGVEIEALRPIEEAMR